MSDFQVILSAAAITALIFPFIYKYANKQVAKEERKNEELSNVFQEKIKNELVARGFIVSRSFIQPPISEYEVQNALKYSHFQYKPFAILLDESQKRVALTNDSGAICIFSINQIRSVMIEKNYQSTMKTTTEKKGVIGKAILGGAIAGETGAIIGASTANETSNSTLEKTHKNSVLIIQTKDFDNPTFKYIYGYKSFVEGEKWHNIINILIEENKG